LTERKERLYLTIRFITRASGAYPGTGSEERERRGEGAERAEPSTGQSARLQFFSLHTWRE